MSAIYNNPTFLRMYWRALQELVNGPLNTAYSGPLLMAKYNAFIANGLSVENPTANIEPWLAQAQSSIASQLAVVNAISFTVKQRCYDQQQRSLCHRHGAGERRHDLDQRRGVSADLDRPDQLDGHPAAGQRNQ
jgi:hypothetical protein